MQHGVCHFINCHMGGCIVFSMSYYIDSYPKQMFDTPIKDRESVVTASDYADELQELLKFYEAGTELSHEDIQYFVDSIVENLNASLGVDVPV